MSDTILLTKNTKYYFTKPVYEFNLPAGTSCPFAGPCRTSVDKETGRFTKSTEAGYKCYAASAERFPSCRNHRHINLQRILCGDRPEVEGLNHVRIHASGDFFSQAYFDMWIETAEENPKTLFWAFTKSLPFWVARIHEIPTNLRLTASLGGTHDILALTNNLRMCKVFPTAEEAIKSGLPICTDDYYAAMTTVNFALVDNHSKRGK